MPKPITERLQFQQSFWNDKAQENARYHILSDESVLDPATCEVSFEAAGHRDARKLACFIDPTSTVVDLGCGIGRVMKRLAPFCSEVIGFDISSEMIDKGKRYLSGIKNARLCLNDGATFSILESESVDFLYSLVCLIHVDKRSAYRYFVDLERILVPGGRAFVQVHNILAPEGTEKFVGAVTSDYPLEFYSLDEITLLLRRAGLDVLRTETYQEFIDVIVVKGDAESWTKDFVESVSIERDLDGIFDTSTPSLDEPGRASFVLRNASSKWRVFNAITRMHGLENERETEEYLNGSAIVRLPPHNSVEVSFEYPGDRKTIRVTADSDVLAFAESKNAYAPKTGPAAVHFAFIPSGFQWNQSVADLIAGSSGYRRLEIK